MVLPLTILGAPGEVFAEIEKRPNWLSPYIICVSIFFLITWLNGCWRNLAEAFSPTYILGPALISPTIVIIVSMSTSIFLYLVSMLTKEESARPLRLKHVLSLNLHCGIILLLGEVINTLLVHADPVGGQAYPLANRFPTGLDVLLPSSLDGNVPLAILLQSTSVFIVWYLVVLARGIRYLSGASTVRAALTVGSLWLITVVFTLSAVHALGGGTTIRIVL